MRVATWYLNTLQFEHFSLTPKNPANSEIAFNTWLPPQLKEIAATQHRCRRLSMLLTQLLAWEGRLLHV